MKLPVPAKSSAYASASLGRTGGARTGGAGRKVLVWLSLTSLLLLLLPRPGRGQALVDAGSLPLLARTVLPPPDSLLLLTVQARRVGISTYAQRTALLGTVQLSKRQQVRYRLLSEWIYDSRGEPPFVREDYAADALHTVDLGGGWRTGQFIRYEQSRANATRTGLWLARFGYQQALPRLLPTQATDSLSVMRLIGFGGAVQDARNGRQDIGVAYGVDFSTLAFLRGAAAPPLALRLLGTRAQLGPRVWQRLLAEGYYEHTFDEYSSGTLRGTYRAHRAEDYVPGNVQRIQSDTLAGQLTWAYRLSDKVSFRSVNALALPSRAFEYRRLGPEADTLQNLGYRQRELDTRQELRLGSQKVQAVLAFGYRERNRAYNLENNRSLTPTLYEAALARERIKDINERTTQWQSELTWLPASRHALSLIGGAQLLRVTAPSRDNQQDRDEAQHQLRMTWTGRWRGNFRTSLALASEYRQFVFIRAALSAENYTDRLLHWEPGFTWAPGKFSIRSTYHLWVSYQVRDRASEQLRNRASRVLEQQQNLTYQLTPRLLATVDYARRENRVGLLRWPAFKESPLDTTITHDLRGGLRYGWTGRRRPVASASSLRLGYRFLEQRTHSRAALVQDAGTSLIYLRALTRQQGPDVTYERRAGSLAFSASLWLQELRTLSRYRPGTGSFVGTSYTPDDLTRTTHDLYPYFEVALAWRLRQW
ncbi:hypothetical protein KBK19_01065 [Microvirga sp. STR05]|uniref:Helix-hairpin-helix domain-containing protein n=1 Tax=Hymenobacter duratus TaxID=2771356 RepID=A0ABR8JAK2_9BACT|nr:hypothetical protein [Hymenobacter duratus]MBD2713616.1 hypothetical protein [Hymenobacter duratus]MBR7948518.1 hypothetical protein [Microvirga sp. STR05]